MFQNDKACLIGSFISVLKEPPVSPSHSPRLFLVIAPLANMNSGSGRVWRLRADDGRGDVRARADREIFLRKNNGRPLPRKVRAPLLESCQTFVFGVRRLRPPFRAAPNIWGQTTAPNVWGQTKTSFMTSLNIRGQTTATALCDCPQRLGSD